jgi:hypothetical protein
VVLIERLLSMKKFTVGATLTVSAWTVIEAETEEESLKIAEAREVGALSSNAIYPDDSESWHFENDGMPQGIKLDT